MAETKEQERERLELFKEGKKRCSVKSGCSQIKTHDEFGLCKAKWDGKASVCLLCARKNGHRHRKESPEASRATARRSYQNNREARLEQKREYRLNNLEAIREYDRQRYLDNPEERRKYNEKIRQEDPLFTRLHLGKVRAKKAGGEWEDISSTELLSYWEQRGITIDSCYYCKQTIGEGELEFDHGQPISRGGGHVPANLFPACVHCNRDKSDRNVAEYFEYLKQAV